MGGGPKETPKKKKKKKKQATYICSGVVAFGLEEEAQDEEIRKQKPSTRLCFARSVSYFLFIKSTMTQLMRVGQHGSKTPLIKPHRRSSLSEDDAMTA